MSKDTAIVYAETWAELRHKILKARADGWDVTDVETVEFKYPESGVKMLRAARLRKQKRCRVLSLWNVVL